MKKNTKYLLIAIIAIICIGYIANINAYKHRLTTFSYWKDQSEIEIKKVPGNNINKHVSYSNITLNMQKSFGKNTKSNSNKTMAITLNIDKSNDEMVIDANGCENLNLEFDKDTKVGFGRFIPFFKVTKFHSDFDVKWSCDVMKENKTFTISKDGSFEIRGKMRLTGFCSAKEVKRVIYSEITKQAQNFIQDDIKRELLILKM